MNRSELAAAVARTVKTPHGVVDDVLTGLEAELLRQVADGGEVKWPGLFTQDVVERSERAGRNPQTGEAMTIPAGRQARLRVGSRLKHAAQTDR
jgi:DNA-binding protein HU-beta